MTVCVSRSEAAELLFFSFCNLWPRCYFFPPPLAAYVNLEEQKQKYSSLCLHLAKISLLASSHHIRILIYSIWIWILKPSVPFKILFKFKAPPPPPPLNPSFPLMKAAQERGYETSPNVPTQVSPLPSFQSLGGFSDASDVSEIIRFCQIYHRGTNPSPRLGPQIMLCLVCVWQHYYSC